MIPAVRAAIGQLQWLAEGRYREALRFVGQVPVDLEEITASGGSDIETRDRRAVGGHSDPTGDAVASSADRQARLADRAETICETARWLRATVARQELPAAPGSLDGAIVDLEWILVIPHLVTAHVPASEEHRRQLHHAIEHVNLEAAALATEVAQALRYSATVAAGRPEPKPMRLCRCCGPMGYHEPATANSDLCEVCKRFRDEHKCWPTKSIRDDRAMGRKRVTPGQLAEAKAAKRSTVKRRRATA